MARALKTVSAFADGSPFSEAQVRWWIFNEKTNGMSDNGVIVRIGKRVYIDTDAFDRWVDSQQQTRREVAV
ncbi:DNA-binding protein [Pseudoxanthomonas spadix]|nr:DNA-binding protein [Pseudoxanthomonas spadix]